MKGSNGGKRRAAAVSETWQQLCFFLLPSFFMPTFSPRVSSRFLLCNGVSNQGERSLLNLEVTTETGLCLTKGKIPREVVINLAKVTPTTMKDAANKIFTAVTIHYPDYVSLEARFDEMEKRFSAMEARNIALEARNIALEARNIALEARNGALEAKVAVL
jgi:hypothetical protein